MSASCIICKTSSEKAIKVTKKGLKTLIECCVKKEESQIQQEIEALEEKDLPVYVHIACRKSFTDKRKLKTRAEISVKGTQSSTEDFNFNGNCLFCNELCIEDPKNPSRKSWIAASTLKLKMTILDICTSRLDVSSNDEWAMAVRTRIQNCIDLVAAKARYHQTCRFEFQTGRKLNGSVSCVRGKGRRTNNAKIKAFLVACRWLENEFEVHSMKQIRDKMQESLDLTPAYISKYL